MELYKEDPIQKKFKENLKKAGVEFDVKGKNRLLTKEEIEERKKNK